VIECNKSNPDELIAASVLRRAVAAQKRGAYVEVEELINRAKEIKPDFSETYRVLAGLEALRNRPYAAEEAYRYAVELGPDSAKARYARAMFLLDNNMDYHEALADLDVALTLDAGDATLEAAKARTLVRLGRYADAQRLYDKLLESVADRPRRWRIITRDQAAESLRRTMEHDGKTGDVDSFVGHLVAACKILRDGQERGDWDEKTLTRLQRVFDEASGFAVGRRSERVAQAAIDELGAFNDEVVLRICHSEASVRELMKSWPQKWISTFSGRSVVPIPDSARECPNTQEGEVGVVVGLLDNFGFIEHRDGRHLFFHRSDVQPSDKWPKLMVGASVRYRVGSNHKGAAAKQVRVIEAESSSLQA
jgi:cold shock CspA family protein